MNEWTEYDGSNQQIEKIENVLNSGGSFVTWDSVIIYNRQLIPTRAALLKVFELTDGFFICNPHPLAEMAKQQFDTGQPVWVKTSNWNLDLSAMEGELTGQGTSEYMIFTTDKPNWNIPSAEYSFTPFEDGIDAWEACLIDDNGNGIKEMK